LPIKANFKREVIPKYYGITLIDEVVKFMYDYVPTRVYASIYGSPFMKMRYRSVDVFLSLVSIIKF
jgi:hypothetical protein